MRLRWFLLPSALLCACASPADRSGPDDDPEPDPGGVALAIPEDLVECRPSAGDEPVGEACQPLLCEALCLAGSYLGCAGAWAACLAGEPVSLGSVTLPCTPLITVACTAGALGTTACVAKECG